MWSCSILQEEKCSQSENALTTLPNAGLGLCGPWYFSLIPRLWNFHKGVGHGQLLVHLSVKETEVEKHLFYHFAEVLCFANLRIA